MGQFHCSVQFLVYSEPWLWFSALTCTLVCCKAALIHPFNFVGIVLVAVFGSMVIGPEGICGPFDVIFLINYLAVIFLQGTSV